VGEGKDEAGKASLRRAARGDPEDVTMNSLREASKKWG
jgi:hypothetical protein